MKQFVLTEQDVLDITVMLDSMSQQEDKHRRCISANKVLEMINHSKVEVTNES